MIESEPMRNRRSLSVQILLLLAAFFAHTTIGQSLTVQLSTNRISLEAISAANLGYRIQSTTNHENWVDISDQASGSFSFFLDLTNAQHRFFRLRTWPTDDAPITLIMIGDSTMADFAANLEMFSGWGQGMHDVFKPNVRVINFAVPVQGTKTFLVSVQRQNLELIKPEFVFVQLGAADGYAANATTIPEYEANLRKIIEIIRGFNGTPVLITPAPARIFDDTGRVIPWLTERCEVVRRLSSELQTYLIDLNKLISDLYNELGPANSAYITWPGDPAHFSLEGADAISALVVDALPNILARQVLDSP